MTSSTTPGNLLCVANFPTGTGFAWDFIESLYAGLAERLEPRGIRTWVAYPRVDQAPRSLEGSPAEPLEHDWSLTTAVDRAAARDLVRRLRVGALYLSDRAVWSPGYALLRRNGVHTVVVHDHTSGLRTRPRGVKRLVKDVRHWLVPGGMADRVLAVSDFVALRKEEVDLVPSRRVTRIWNSVDVPECVPDEAERARIRERFGLAPTRPLVICVGRAAREKGIHHLFRAFDAMLDEAEFAAEESRPILLYLGDGPAMREFRALRQELAHAEDIRLGGYVGGAAEVVGAADLAVVPSTWAEAFGLAALEPLSQGVPVVASNVGGLPEVVRHGVDGFLVPPGDEVALARALYKLLTNPDLRREMGARGRERALSEFSRQVQLDRLEEVFVREMFG